jgi:hypothetical protein
MLRARHGKCPSCYVCLSVCPAWSLMTSGNQNVSYNLNFGQNFTCKILTWRPKCPNKYSSVSKVESYELDDRVSNSVMGTQFPLRSHVQTPLGPTHTSSWRTAEINIKQTELFFTQSNVCEITADTHWCDTLCNLGASGFFSHTVSSIGFSSHAVPSIGFCSHTVPSISFSSHTVPSSGFSSHTVPSVGFSSHTVPSIGFCSHTVPSIDFLVTPYRAVIFLAATFPRLAIAPHLSYWVLFLFIHRGSGKLMLDVWILKPTTKALHEYGL